jgi:hypothetical protein
MINFDVMKKAIYSFGITVFLSLMAIVSDAQCAMCKANAENASENVDKGIGESLNSGIVYLMGIPYFLLATVAIIFFRKKIAAFFKG